MNPEIRLRTSRRGRRRSTPCAISRSRRGQRIAFITGLRADRACAQDEPLEEVIVTGSILRRTDAETPSPVTVISAEDLAERGINTVSEAVQRLSANNAGTIQAGWNTGFNFATGATASCAARPDCSKHTFGR